jgi:hypothetical protein
MAEMALAAKPLLSAMGVADSAAARKGPATPRFVGRLLGLGQLPNWLQPIGPDPTRQFHLLVE